MEQDVVAYLSGSFGDRLEAGCKFIEDEDEVNHMKLEDLVKREVQEWDSWIDFLGGE